MKNISLAIIEVMKEIEWVAKAKTVWKWDNSYKWVADKDVKQALRDSMTKNWLSILPTGVESKIQVDRWEEEDSYSKSVPKAMKSKQSIFTEVTTKYILLHTSGESIELAWYWQGVDTQDKGAGKATTYALKNTLLNMFLIPTGVDTDNTHSDEYDVPAKKTTTTYSRKADEYGLTLDDYIENINMESDTETIKLYFTRWLELCTTEKQKDFFVSVKDKRKKQLGV